MVIARDSLGMRTSCGRFRFRGVSDSATSALTVSQSSLFIARALVIRRVMFMEADSRDRGTDSSCFVDGAGSLSVLITRAFSCLLDSSPASSQCARLCVLVTDPPVCASSLDGNRMAANVFADHL